MAEIIEKTGKSYNIFDKVNNVWNKISFWHKASDCEFNDGKTAQTKVGAIDGITSDLSGESETVAASIKCVNQLNNSLTNVNVYVGEDDGKLHFVDSAGADSVLPFNTSGNYGTFTFNSSGNITVDFGTNPKEIVVLFGTKTASYNLFSCYNEDYPSMNKSNNNFAKTDTGFTLNTNNSTAFAGAKGQYIWR